MNTLDRNKPRPEDEELDRARKLLLANGFSRSATDSLTKRWRMVDEFAKEALKAIIARHGAVTSDELMLMDADTAYRYAKAMMNRRGLE